MSDFGKFVHEWRDQYGQRWWIVAALEDGFYSAPVRPGQRRALGTGKAWGNLEHAAAVGYCYRRRQDALRRARIEYGWQDVERRGLVREA